MELILTKDLSQSYKDLDVKQGIVTGYFAAFDMLDSDGDVIQKGAFTKTIRERGPEGTGRIKYLQDHDKYKAVGTLKELKEDSYGLYYEGKVGQHTVGRDFLLMVEDGIISEHSFGYRVIKEEKNQKGENVLKELYMAEGSGLQVDAANPFTPVTGIKSESDLLVLLKSLEKALKNGNYSDDCFKNTIIPSLENLKSILPQLSTEPPESKMDYKSIISQKLKFH